MVIIIELRLDLGIRGLKIALRTNLKSGPRFAEVCYRWDLNYGQVQMHRRVRRCFLRRVGAKIIFGQITFYFQNYFYKSVLLRVVL